MTNKKTFPELRGVMAKYGLTNNEMAKVIGNTYQTFGKKLDARSEFSFSDMLKIREHFTKKGEELSIETLFFKWKFTIVNSGAN